MIFVDDKAFFDCQKFKSRIFYFCIGLLSYVEVESYLFHQFGDFVILSLKQQCGRLVFEELPNQYEFN